MTAEELLERYAAGERDFRNIQDIGFGNSDSFLSQVNLSGIDLSGSVLEERFMERTNFTKAILRETNFFESVLDGAIFREADLTNASLYFADLDRADLTHAKLIEANLGGASMIGANLTGADLTGADLHGTYLDGANLTDANLFEAFIGDQEAGFAYLETAIFCNTIMPDGTIRTDT
ncbi:pentapeptide repeat-containing protein [Acaryochloris sp. IP29b_bin.137]|uniref:pentapeptide repeat-containing protein n=1 Tax=Acaryochloris sp. IP29b_bin.137 TaxID=2969217 RepID=UPI00260CDF05|nr:pentapeptide repeat-containing protein [Acaryochloris sp. IP29b_bin.137]